MITAANEHRSIHPTARGKRSPAGHGFDLFSGMVGEALGDLKSGSLVANRIEEDLIRRGWPVGTMYGALAELAQHFHVGRAVISEAVRVLEVRGTARMRRGPHGGLQVLRPGRTQIVESASEYILLSGITAQQSAAARVLIEKVKARLRDTQHLHASQELEQIADVLSFFDELVAATDLAMSGGAVKLKGSMAHPLFHRSRAGQIARRLMSERTPQEWTRGMRLGSAFDLCERYGTYRGVLRQAQRILESAGLAVSQSGRGHGFISRAPRPASTCRLMSCYFAAHGLTAAASVRLFHEMSSEAVGTMAESATSTDLARVFHAIARMEQASADAVADAMFELEESQLAILGNPLVDLFLRSTKAFSSCKMSSESTALDDVYLEETRKVAAALARNDRAAAMAAQEHKCHRLASVAGHPAQGWVTG